MTPGTPAPGSIVRIRIDDARAAGRYDAYAASAVGITPTHLRVRRADYDRIRAAPVNPLPLGDWTKKAIHAVTLGRGEAIAEKVAKAAGKKGCGCKKRQAKLNALGARIAGRRVDTGSGPASDVVTPPAEPRR